MKRTTITLILVTLAVAVVLSGCDLFGTSPKQRLEQFVDDANASPRVEKNLQDHFSPEANDYSSMNTSGYWENSFFDFADRQFRLGSISVGDADSRHPGSRTATSSITSKVSPTARPLRAVFVRDGMDWVIRELVITIGESTEEFKNIAPNGVWSIR
ncbi:MAG: hypothetical protein EA382_04305 [Spirochaetaceae bacterium]|nr:MAG: hypothetical protein EA382_04305 [Spirochaetaceae bacterium]